MRLKMKSKKNWLFVKIDCTTETPECKEAEDLYHVIGWPTVIFVGQNQNEVKAERLVGRVVTPEDMQSILDRVKNAGGSKHNP